MAPSNAEREAFQHSKVEILVPGGQAASNLRTIKQDVIAQLREGQRSQFYFDEILPVVVVISAALPESSLTTCLEHSYLSVSAHLHAYSPQQEQGPHGFKQEPSIKVTLGSFSANTSSPKHVYSHSQEQSSAAFIGELHLHHPERQVLRPNIYFAASLRLDMPPTAAPDPLDDYLPSGVPLPANLLAPLLASPAFAGTKLNLPASRLEKMVPISATPMTEAPPIRGTSVQSPIIPALLLRTSRTLFPDQVYLSVDTQVPMNSKTTVELLKAEARLPSSSVSALTTIALPASLKPGDRTTFIFRTHAQAGASIAQYRLTASLRTANGTDIKLTIRRNLNAPQGAKVPTRERVKYWSVPKGTSRPPSTVTGPKEPNENTKQGLKITINAPKQIQVGEILSVNFFVSNNGARKRRLSILGPSSPAPSRGANRSSWIASRSNNTTSRVAGRENISNAVVESRELYAQITGQKHADKRRSAQLTSSAASKPVSQRAEIVTLDPEIRLGTLQPGACHEVSMKIRVVSVGVINIEGMVVADLDTRETCLIGEGWEGVCHDPDHEPDLTDTFEEKLNIAKLGDDGLEDLLISDVQASASEELTASMPLTAETENG
ncbi:hypothetical protein B9Z65_2200 [Elsinoe australis]|uniref:Trafficking protein particle complex II-specific subunit 65 IgD3 domain-containing protein n=1 Tax=Elsinoe australis TaxID=40998 RepID=A0A2P7YNB4_9PEZI|nr:hypothetical protein B9Z65_2200 [Elsinoe australis]